jgi:probable F420-dependent oxidoreductase
LDVWTSWLRTRDVDALTAAAVELETLGFHTVWLPGRETYPGPDALANAEQILQATQGLSVATGILNVWRHDPDSVAARSIALGPRFLLGLGVSHAPTVEEDGHAYVHLLDRMRAFLDGLDAAAPPVAAGQRVLAALRPGMLRLSRDRAAGAHPYLAPPEHTAAAREVLGTRPLLVPEQTVVLETEPTTARATARGFLRGYLGLPNYVGNLLAHGFTDEDVAGEGSDRLVDRVVPWGTPEQVLAVVREHLDAGADRVAVQAVTDPGLDAQRSAWRALAAAAA